MRQTNKRSDRAGPLWAVLGAPLVGVPLMVGLLAIGTGSTAEATVEPDGGFQVEQVSAPPAESAGDVDTGPTG